MNCFVGGKVYFGNDLFDTRKRKGLLQEIVTEGYRKKIRTMLNEIMNNYGYSY